jgi:TetR/AcrR family transcriptional regulator, transcriptional repressor for nem operon
MVGMDTRTALLNCAEDALRTRGFDGFSYADLAVEVGIRKASIHYHFPTKADLALALIERYSENFFAALDAITVANTVGGDRLKAYVEVCRRALDGGNKLCLCVAFCTGRDGLSVAVLAKLDMFHATVTTWLAGMFAQAKGDGSIASVINPQSEAHACLALMEGAQLIARAAKDIGRFDAAVACLLGRAATVEGAVQGDTQ